MGAGSTISWKTAHIHQLLHLSCSWTHSPHCRKQGDSRAVLPSSYARGCCLHGSAETWITFSRLPFPAVTSPPTLGGLSQARDHLAPHLMEASNFHKEAQSPSSLWEQRPQMKGLKDISPFNSRSSHHSLAAVLTCFRCIRTTFKYQKFRFSNISALCFIPLFISFKNAMSKGAQASEFPVKPVPYFQIKKPQTQPINKPRDILECRSSSGSTY